MSTEPKFIEHALAETLKSMLFKELERLEHKQNTDVLEDKDVLRLEKLSKVFAVVMADTRENIKQNIFGKMSTDQLEDAVNESDDSDEED